MAADGGSVIWGGRPLTSGWKKDRGLIQDGVGWWECVLGWETAGRHREIAGAAAAGRPKEETEMIVSFFFNNKWMYKDGFFSLFLIKKNVMSDRFHRDRNNVRRVG